MSPGPEQLWWGQRNGRVCSKPWLLSSSPATEWTAVSSRASAGSSGGSSPASRWASIVLPLPGGPQSSRWWPPAAAISRARRPWGCPLTSARSSAAGLAVIGALACLRAGAIAVAVARAGAAGRARGCCSRHKAWPRSAAPHTRSPSTNAASQALAWGTTKARAPWFRAAIAIASTPRIGRKLPSSPSSPALQISLLLAASSWPLASSSPRAIGRSKAGPSLRRSAGARFTTTRVSGTFRLLWRMAERTRSRASCTAASARPTSCRPGKPGARSTSTSTGLASRPCSAAVLHRANITPWATTSLVPPLSHPRCFCEPRHDLWAHPPRRDPLRSGVCR